MKLSLLVAALAAAAAGILLYAMTTLAGEVHLDFPTFARVNVTDDPHGYAPAIAMPSKIRLRVQIDNGVISLTGDPPWVDVDGTIVGEDIVADGMGTVLGLPNIDVEFEGTLIDGVLTGQYLMGTDLQLPVQSGDPAPIEYTLKPNVLDTPTPTPTQTPTNTTQPAATATPTSTAGPTSTSTPVPTDTVGPTSTPPQPPRDGDLNKDGMTNSLDALLVFQFVADLLIPLPNEHRADVNGDGIVNVLDAQLMLQLSAGFLDSLPVG